MKAHDILLALLICLSVVSYIFTVIFNSMSAVAQNGLFLTTASNISARYPLDITPAGWTFSIWSVIYIWNGLWIVYVFSTLFRRNKMGRVYANPTIHHPEFFALWILNNVINIGWLFLWSRELLICANVFLALIPITCYMMLYVSYRRCYHYRAWMLEHQRFDLWCIRILVHNGLAIYATWTTIATMMNFGIVLKYRVNNVVDPDVSSVVLSLVFFAVLFWFLMETFIFEKYVHYTFTIYPVAIAATVGVFVGAEESENLIHNDIINIVIIGACSLFCLFRFALLFSCDKLRPLISENKVDLSKEFHVNQSSTSHSSGHINPMDMEADEL